VTSAWRLVKKEHERDAFSGEGARRFGGRWNHRGTRVVYVSDSLALAALETFVHLGPVHVGLLFATFLLEIPDDVAVESVPIASLPPTWRLEPAPDGSKDVGSSWVKSERTAVLEVPSVIVPIQRNYVLNVSHPDFRKVVITQRDDFTFDPRMWK
jgi:RES domain-containing protein